MARFNERIATGLARIATQAGVTVTLRRGTDETADVTAIVGRTLSQNAGADGTELKVRTRDYLIDVEDYIIDGTAAEPLAGDEIDEIIDGVTVTFEVAPIATNDASWQWSDGNRSRYRIHTREVDASE